MICNLNILFNHPGSEATPNSKITGAYPGALQVQTGAIMAHPEALETHPGVVGAHPGTVDCGGLL